MSDPSSPEPWNSYQLRTIRGKQRWLLVAGILVVLSITAVIVLPHLSRSKPAVVPTHPPTTRPVPAPPDRSDSIVKTPVRELFRDFKTDARLPKPQAPIDTTLYKPASATKPVPIEITMSGVDSDAQDVVAARSVLDRYLHAQTLEERLSCVFDAPHRLDAMERYYGVLKGTDPEPEGFRGALVISGGTTRILHLSFRSASRPVAGLRANFHRTSDGAFLLDWDSWIAWGEKSWEEFKSERSRLPVLMRAFAEESTYYNYEFDEEWRWLAVKLRSADGLHSVIGYVARDSGIGIAIAQLIGVPLPAALAPGVKIPPLRPKGSKHPVTVRLAFPPVAHSDHCVQIVALVADRWVLFEGEE